jgi:hypothetical protein
MSTANAIDTVTKTLVELLSKSGNPAITTKPLDKMPTNGINLFLYQITKHPTWENCGFPNPNDPTSTKPPLPLVLHYILTNCLADPGTLNEDIGQQNLGKAMLKLHDEPILNFSGSQIIKQRDPIRVTWKPMTLDEISKIWSTFHTPYRTSAMYEVGVVLIESEIPASNPPPVLKRGADDHGWDSSTAFPPILTGVRFQTDNQPGAQLGETVTLIGSNLRRAQPPEIELAHQTLGNGATLETAGQRENSITFKLESNQTELFSGVYSVRLKYTVNDRVTFSNTITFPLLPKIVSDSPIEATKEEGEGHSRLVMRIKLAPPVAKKQSLSVSIGSVSVFDNEVPTIHGPTSDWDFKVSKALLAIVKNEGRYIRVRVDGVESIAYDPSNPADGFLDQYLVEGIDS